MRRRPLRPRRTRLRLLRRRPPRTRIVPRARTRLGLRWGRLRRRRRRRGRGEWGGGGGGGCGGNGGVFGCVDDLGGERVGVLVRVGGFSRERGCGRGSE